MQGRSFVSILKGEPAADWRTAMYYRYYHYPKDHRVQPHYGIRTERYKLIHFNKINEWELFDLGKDPRELFNIYSDPARAEILRDLKSELGRLRQQLDDRDQFADLQESAETSVDRIGPDGNLTPPSK
jgi:arylsulfatase A-like enzyme